METKPERWTIHICEDHRAQDCAICGAFDVVEVVRLSLLEEALGAIRQHWNTKYTGRPAEVPIAAEDRMLYEVSPRLRSKLAGRRIARADPGVDE